MDPLPSPPDLSLGAFLHETRSRGASDLHLAAGSVPCVRRHGELQRFDMEPLSVDVAERLGAELLALAGEADGKDVDFCIDAPGQGRFRVNLHRQHRGVGMALKCIPLEIPDLEELGLPESFYRVTDYRVGLVLVTGPTGCGKSSTLAALVQRINETRQEHVITIEDPIEFVFRSASCNITQREVGPHTRSFRGALRAALREDPDVILVSELRDVDTMRTAIIAAETGHLVLGTLHTADAISTINRLLDAFPPREQRQIRAMVAGSLRTVISQRLLPRAGGGTRVPACEILHVNSAVSGQIRDGRTSQLASILQIGRKRGMIDLDARLEELIEEGEITWETARRYAKDARRFGGGRR